MTDSKPKTKTALCSAVGVTRPTLDRYVSKGLDLDKYKDTDGFDVEGVRFEMVVLGYRPKADLDGLDATELEQLKRELEVRKLQQDIAHREVETELKTIKKDIENGQLVPLEDMQERDIARVLVVRNGLRALPRRLAQECQGLPVPEAEAIMERHMRNLCDQFAEM